MIKSVKSFLDGEYKLGRLRSTYLICTDDNKKVLHEIEEFLPRLFCSDVNEMLSNMDYRVISQSQGCITIDQIRELKLFLYKTPLFMDRKVAVLLDADKMNINAANCCLKILEEAPDNSHIFLITTNIDRIIDTILSRCVKLYCFFHKSKDFITDQIYSKMLLKEFKVEDKISFIKKCETVHSELWDKFTTNTQNLLYKFWKRSLLGEKYVVFDEIENKLWEQFSQKSSQFFDKKYRKIDKIICDMKEFSLDIWSGYILIIKYFEQTSLA